MNWTKWVGVFLLVAFGTQDAWAGERSRAFQVSNRLRVEYDDNIYQTDSDEQDSLKIIEEIEFIANIDMEQTFISLRYRPVLTIWEDRNDDDSDVHHDLDIVLNHKFNPRVTLSVSESFRYADLPELVDRGATVRGNEDYINNTLVGVLGYLIRPATRAELSGRWTLLRYDEDDLGDLNDYDLYVGGLTLRHQLVRETSVSTDLRVESIDYDADDRNSDSFYAGAGIEHIFGPQFLGSIRGGYQYKEFDSAASDDESTPFGDIVVTYLPSPATRLSAGAGFSQFESDIATYANQERTRVFASFGHDFTAKISLYLAGSYTYSDYTADQAIVVDGTALDVPDGDENIYLFSTRVTYKLNRSNWLEAGWQYTDLDSDLRENYERNRLNLGWRVKI